MSRKITYALIMAAGRGSRMMPLTDVIPKAMAPYAGSTLIANGIDRIRKYIPHIYITVGYKGPILAQHVIEHHVSGIFNTTGKDNAWWIFNTLMKELDEPVFLLTCDNVTELDFELIEREYFEFGAPACMVVPVKPVPGLEGDYIFHDGNVVRKLDRNDPSEMYCSGIQVLNPKKINCLIEEADNFYDVWSRLIDIKQLYCGDVYPSKWYVADTLQQLSVIPV